MEVPRPDPRAPRARRTTTPPASTSPRPRRRPAKAALPESAAAPAATPTYDEIARRAYEISLARNGGPGDALSDWLQAERELASAGT
jgi:hypothetical protein